MGCRRSAKGGVELSFWPRAIANGAELRTGARVTEVLTHEDGRAAGALYVDRAGATHRATASAVVLAANGIGTPRLMLHSRSARFPDGLANGSGLVGKNLMFHPIAAVTGIFDRVFDPTGGAGVSILSNEFYGTRPEHDFVRGYMLAGPRVHGPLATALGAWGQPMRWGAAHHSDMDALFGHAGALVISCEDLPRESNGVSLDPDIVDGDGVPAPRVSYALDDNSQKMLRHALDRSDELWAAAGAARTIRRPLLAQAGFHLMGTARMGDDSGRSVVDRWGRSHESPNLFVIDGSAFVTSAAVNPTPTILALALRTADHMIAMRR
jgi:choline dehydrogenase-like flavoprotein